MTGFVDSLLSLNIDSLLQYSISLIPLGLGFVIGLFAVSKGIDYLFNNFPSLTYSGIIGLVLASPIAILLNTNAVGHLQNGNTLILLSIGLVACLACFLLTYYLGTKDEWNNISGSGNIGKYSPKGALTIHCTDGDIEGLGENDQIL